MKRALLVILSSPVVAVSSLSAQEKRVEVSPFIGYSLSEGVGVDPFNFLGSTYNQVDPASGLTYGFSFGVFINEFAEVEFLFGRQDSELRIGGTNDVDLTGMRVDNYHVNFLYNFGDEDAVMRPFLFGGLGATSYGFDDIEGVAIDGETQLSSDWGGGVKFYPGGGNVGIRLQGRWTPTYIKSDPAGIWCSPFWPWACYVVSDTDFSNQLGLTAAVSLRF